MDTMPKVGDKVLNGKRKATVAATSGIDRMVLLRYKGDVIGIWWGIWDLVEAPKEPEAKHVEP